MSADRNWIGLNLALLGVTAIGIGLCIAGGIIDPSGFFRAWLPSFLFWLGLPLAGVTLVLVHDLSGGRWMGTARPALAAAIATMPLATLAAIPAWFGLHDLYSWTHPAPSLTNTFYLNHNAFLLRYAVYVVLWNLLAAYALWAPRAGGEPIAPALSWISGIGLVLLAFSASFAAIDWIMSIEPSFWSSVFMMIIGASWFNTGFALIVLVICVTGARAGPVRDHLADLAAILLATTIFWAYVEFCQFLIIWESDLSSEIPWYLDRLVPVWRPAIYIAAGFGFFVPFFVLLWGPCKRRPLVVATVCVLILLSRIAYNWWLILPAFRTAGPFWLDVGAILALGGPILLLFFWALAYGAVVTGKPVPVWGAHHG